MKNILVTGGAGFIGSNFVPYFLEKNPDCAIINLDAMTYAASHDNLVEVAHNPRYTFIKGSIADKELVNKIFDENNIDGVIHFAAESHVDNSISGPEVFFETNVMGTFYLAEAARKQWMDAPHNTKADKTHCRFLHVSTDEVYGTLGDDGFFTENTPYAPNSPYSASKAGSDFVIRSYFHTYGMNVVTTNCSNNYGPKQHAEKLIPTIIRKALAGLPIPIYGDGKNVRDWLFVIDHCSAINEVFFNGKTSETYIVGTRNEKNNLEIVHTICALLDELKPLASGSYTQYITFVTDRAGHDRRYAIDPTKIETELKWQAQYSFEQALRATVEWYVK